MKTVRVCLMAVAAAFCALVLCPGVTRADTLTGSTGITWVFGTSTFATDTIADGSSLSCPGASPICAGYSGYGSETFSVGTSSISYSVSNYPVGKYGGTIQRLRLHGTDLRQWRLARPGFTLDNEQPGLTDADITFGLVLLHQFGRVPVDGSFTLDLTSGPSVSTPEPSSFLLLGIGLLALAGLTRKRPGSARRFAVSRRTKQSRLAGYSGRSCRGRVYS